MSVLLLLALLAQESKDLDEVIKGRLDAKTPGVAVLVLKNGEVLHKKGYGLAVLTPATDVSPGTLFELASCSKQFTALGILLLNEKRRLKLEDDVRTWLKEFKVHDKARPIRVLDLVHHTSGLPDYLDFLAEVQKTGPLNNEDALKLIATRKLDFPTGSKWAYSNSNYCMLALIIERIAKKSFGAFMKEELFTPLKMKTATVLEKGVALKNAAAGYSISKEGIEEVKSSVLTTGDGGVYLSLDDWVAFETGLKGLLKKESLELAYTPGKLDNGKFHSYGFGLVVTGTGPDRAVGHEGAWGGFRAYSARLLEGGVSVILMANGDSAKLKGVADAIAAKLRE